MSWSQESIMDSITHRRAIGSQPAAPLQPFGVRRRKPRYRHAPQVLLEFLRLGAARAIEIHPRRGRAVPENPIDAENGAAEAPMNSPSDRLAAVPSLSHPTPVRPGPGHQRNPSVTATSGAATPPLAQSASGLAAQPRFLYTSRLLVSLTPPPAKVVRYVDDDPAHGRDPLHRRCPFQAGRLRALQSIV